MNTSLRGVAAILSGLLVSGAQLQAQGARDHRGSGGRVVLYAEADFRGDSIVLYPGDRIEDFARQPFDSGQPANDKISSVAIEGRVEIVLYADGRFRGDTLRLTDSVSNLSEVPGPSRRGHWNDLASAATVQTVEDRRPRPRPRPHYGDRNGPRVELYADANYRGSRVVLGPGDRVDNLADVAFEDDDREANDQISSIRIVGPIAVMVHEHSDFRGASTRIAESVSNLAFRSGSGGRTWNDAISSLSVVKSDGRSSDAVVRTVYRDLLDREPDAAGLANYVRAIEERGMTEDELRQHIRRSREYREREAVQIVRRAYRDILRREPDEGGQANYVGRILDAGWSESHVREALRSSEEFKQLPRSGR